MRCLFCRTELDTVHWAFDGVSDQPAPACKACCDRLRLVPRMTGSPPSLTA